MNPGNRVEKFRFGDFELDARAGELRKKDVPVKLQLQPLNVLALLVKRAGEVISREEIRQHVWGQGTFVDYEQGLNYCISQIRAALGEDGQTARYIETLPRRGYRFIAPVTERLVLEVARVMLAVLPLENLSADQEQEYLSDGLTDEIISKLASSFPENLGLIARTSAMQYKRTAKAVSQIGRELSVDFVVEGTVRRNGSRVRISAQLIRVSDQTHVWAQVYERELGDLFALQSELALAIAREVGVKLVPGKRPDRGERALHPEAYETYLRGRYLWNRRTKADLFRSLELFGSALEKDWEYPAAFAGLADAYLSLLDYRWVRASEALAQATVAAVNALRLDDELADAHASLGHAKLHACDWESAEREFRKSIELAPGYAPAHFYYANLLLARGRFDEAIIEARLALKLDPVSAAAESNLAMALFYARRLEEATDSCRKTMILGPESPRPHEDLGRILLERGKSQEALTALERAMELSNHDSRYLASLAYGYAVAGDKDRAREILAELRAISKQKYVDAYDVAFVHAALGETDEAILSLEQAWEERSSALPFLKIDHRLRSLGGDARFGALLTRVGLGG